MKKSFLIGIAAAAMLAGCSNDETVEVAQSKAISFSDAFVNKSTRALYTDNTSLATDGFAVYGFTQNGQIFAGEQVTSSDNGNTWSYTPPKYWIEGNKYVFAAIAPASSSDITVSDVVTTANVDKVTMKVAFTNSNGTTDLLYAAPSAIPTIDASFLANVQPVPMTFNHLLSKVKFTFKNLMGQDYNIVVNDIQITDAKKTGNYIISENEAKWNDVTDATLELDFGNVGSTDSKIVNTNSGASKELLMIPYDNTGVYTVKFSIVLYQDNVEMKQYTHELQIQKVELKSGYCYNFVAEVTPQTISGGDDELQKIEFAVEEVAKWIDSEETLGNFVESTEGN